jgi:hypothetical protein
VVNKAKFHEFLVHNRTTAVKEKAGHFVNINKNVDNVL